VETARAIVDGLACPRCAGALEALADGYRCQRCETGFPVFGNIPCLVPDPGLFRAMWLSRLESYSASVELRAKSLRDEARSDDLLPRTKKRLERVAAGFEEQVEAIDALFEPVTAGADLLPALAIPARPEALNELAILECYENVFRDWVWGNRECEASLGLVKPLLPPKLARVAVYGAGAGRLAVDLHQACEPERTFALDVNPLPFLVAEKLLSARVLSLPEFPVDPRWEDEVVVSRSVSCPFRVRSGFTLLFADALRPPMLPGSLDAVVTSWFIDVVRTDLRQTVAAINRVLRPGGTWVNLGPLRFHSVLSRSYTFDEARDIVGQSGFEITTEDTHDIPYFDSPVSGSRRTETVLRFHAKKTEEAKPVEIPDAVAPWVANPLMPIPITPALVALGRQSLFTSGVLSMIDGSRSIVEVARELGASWGIEPARLQDELRAFLAMLPSSQGS
jgi:SAM-dependent methyltransferase